MSAPDSEFGEIERYVAVGELSARQTAELALVGLKWSFPQAVNNLNDAVYEAIASPLGYGSFTGYRFTLQPDGEKPRVDVEENRYCPYTITVEADLLKRGTFSVVDKLKSGNLQHSPMLNWVTLDAIKDFASAYPGDHDIRLRAIGIIDAPTFNIPIDELTDQAQLKELEVSSTTHELRMEFSEDENTKLLMPIDFSGHAGRSDLNFGIGEILAKAPADEIETIVNAYRNLIANDWDTEQ